MVGPADDEMLTPIKETREAFDWLKAFGDSVLEDSVSVMARRVRQIVPECVAISVAVLQGELTFTLTADRQVAALLDAMQYLDGGPCVHAVDEEAVQATHGATTDEEQWRMFAAAEVLTGIASTLSLPVMEGGRVVGGVNLYGSTKDAFDGHHDDLARALGAWAGGAVTNADLAFTSRVRAATTPDRLRDRTDADIAIGVIAEYQQVNIDEARRRLHDAAVRAGVSDGEFARFIQDAHLGSQA